MIKIRVHLCEFVVKNPSQKIKMLFRPTLLDITPLKSTLLDIGWIPRWTKMGLRRISGTGVPPVCFIPNSPKIGQRIIVDVAFLTKTP